MVRTRMLLLLIAAALLGAACTGGTPTSELTTTTTKGTASGGAHGLAPLVMLRAPGRVDVADVLGLRRTGIVELVDARTGRVLGVIASGVDPLGGLAERESLRIAYVTAAGQDGRPAIWSIPLTSGGRSEQVVADAELPSLSPDGGFLGYVTLDRAGRQDGVAITALDAVGLSTGATQRFASTTVPPPLPIAGVAVGRRDSLLAVWGGFLDPYLGQRQQTVGTLVPDAASSLAQMTALNDGSGLLSIGPGPPPAGSHVPFSAPKWHHTAPVYEPDGLLLVGSPGRGITVDDANANSSTDEKIFPAPGLAPGHLSVVFLAYGPDADLAFETPTGELEVVPRGANLPYGPAVNPDAWMPDPPPTMAIGNGFTAVAWTPGPSARSTPPPKPWNGLDHVPDLVGMTLARATRLLISLRVPEQVSTVPSATVPKGIVVAQSPPYPDGMACQCAVVLRVSGGAG